MSVPSLTDAEKERVRFHLGYPQTDANFTVGAYVETPINRQMIFLLERSMQHVTAGAADNVRSILRRMDDLLRRQEEDVPDLVQATRISDINPNQTADLAYDRMYRRWGNMLGDILAVRPYPGSARYRGTSGTIQGFRLRGV